MIWNMNQDHADLKQYNIEIGKISSTRKKVRKFQTMITFIFSGEKKNKNKNSK